MYDDDQIKGNDSGQYSAGAGQNNQSYGQSSASYGQDGQYSQNYGPSNASYSQGGQYSASYGQTGASYGQGSQNTQTYGQSAANYGQNGQYSHSYGQTGASYGQSSQTYGQTAQSTQSRRTYGQTAQSTQSSRTYGQPAQSGQAYQYSNNSQGAYAQPKKKEKKKKTKTGKAGAYWKKVLVAVSLGLFFGICAGLGLFAVSAVTGLIGGSDSETVVSENVTQESAEEPVPDIGSAVSNGSIQTTDTVTTVVTDITDVVAQVMPAVVSINNTYTEKTSYFGQTMTTEAVSSGSGIIVGENDTELLIATNYHVVEDTEELTVQFVEGTELEAVVKGTDSGMDLAVIAVPLDSIPSSTLSQITIATLGDSDSLTVGEPAIAIGNALGYGQSVTTGVISALDREIELSTGSTGTFIQTDAAINPGNSGGALLNIKGEVIGINSNKIGGTTIEGMGYAIPISAAKPIIAELMLKETRSKVSEDERGYLGISGISVTSDVSSVYGMPQGVYVAQVYDGSAAAAAGLQRGDIITAFDGDTVTSMDELQKLLEYYAKGDTVDMTVMTAEAGGYQSRTVTITLGNKITQ